MVEFKELDSGWSSLPEWASFSFDVGYHAAGFGTAPRRIVIASFPVESAAAGLMALGALRRHVEDPKAHDLAAHFGRIQRLYDARDTQVILKCQGRQSAFQFDFSRTDCGIPWAVTVPANRRSTTKSGQSRFNITPDSCLKWRFSDEPFVEITGGELPFKHTLSALRGAPIEPANQNFRRSYSELCLVGRHAGEAPTLRCYDAIRLRAANEEAPLSAILSINAWTNGQLSRMRFFNSRSGEFDRAGLATRLAVVDGEGACFSTLDDQNFIGANLVISINRSIDRNAIDRLKEKFQGKAQWYESISARSLGFSAPPRGVCLTVLQHRS